MKKAIALVLLAVMTLLCVPSASASWLTLAQDGGAQDIILSASGSAQNLSAKFSPSICDTDEIEKFPSFSEVDGVYTARSYAADTALRSLVSGSSNGCFFTVEVSG
ncbi:MAG: hypothetical protein PHU22_09370, partial [Eubacteriales bacterium]|nr:hypothetical protein [Eubacteriales bacterium]